METLRSKFTDGCNKRIGGCNECKQQICLFIAHLKANEKSAEAAMRHLVSATGFHVKLQMMAGSSISTCQFLPMCLLSK